MFEKKIKKYLVLGVVAVLLLTVMPTIVNASGTHFGRFAGYVFSFSLDENGQVEQFTIMNGAGATTTFYIPEDGRSDLLTSIVIDSHESGRVMEVYYDPGTGEVNQIDYYPILVDPSIYGLLFWDPKFLFDPFPLIINWGGGNSYPYSEPDPTPFPDTPNILPDDDVIPVPDIPGKYCPYENDIIFGDLDQDN